jgi:hypothetical protein
MFQYYFWGRTRDDGRRVAVGSAVSFLTTRLKDFDLRATPTTSSTHGLCCSPIPSLRLLSFSASSIESNNLGPNTTAQQPVAAQPHAAHSFCEPLPAHSLNAVHSLDAAVGNRGGPVSASCSLITSCCFLGLKNCCTSSLGTCKHTQQHTAAAARLNVNQQSASAVVTAICKHSSNYAALRSCPSQCRPTAVNAQQASPTCSHLPTTSTTDCILLDNLCNLSILQSFSPRTISCTPPAQRCRASSVACHPCRSAAPLLPLQSRHHLL